jgi:hypothetical protein
VEHDALLATTVVDTDEFNLAYVVDESDRLLKSFYPSAEIIADSIRSVLDLKEAGLAGAHIEFLSPNLFPAIASHYKTDEAVNSFLADIDSWLN